MKDRKIGIYRFIYTCLFIVLVIGVFYPFIKNQKSFVWEIDGMYSYFPSMCYVRNYYLDMLDQVFQGRFAFKMVDFTLGEGADVLGSLGSSNLFDPFWIASVIVREEHLEIYFAFSIVLRLYLAGVSFQSYAAYMKQGYCQSLAGSLVYVFSGWGMINFNIPGFIWVLVFLPFMLSGIEEAMQKKMSRRLVFCTALLTVYSYYWLYMILIFAFFYAFFRYPELYKWKINNFFSVFFGTAGQIFMGIGCGAVVLVPSMCNFFLSSRNTVKEEVVSSLLHYDTLYYKCAALQLILPYGSPGYTTQITCAAVGTIGILLCWNKKSVPRFLKKLLAASIVGISVPLVGKMFNGFSYVSNRWDFCYVFVVAVIVMFMYEDLCKITGLEVMSVLCIVLLLYILNVYDEIVTNGLFETGAAVICVTLFVLRIAAVRYGGKSGKELKTMAMFLGVTMFSIILAGNTFNGDRFGRNAQAYIAKGDVWNQLKNSSPAASVAAIADEEFHRDAYVLSGNTAHMNKNMVNQSMALGYQGTNSYFSVMDRYRANYYRDAELPTLWSDFLMYGYDDRTFMNALASVKYYVTEQGRESYVPYGYSFLREHKRTSAKTDGIYKNDNYLPLGVTYTSYITEEDSSCLSALERQETMMKSVILDQSLPQEYDRKQEETTVQRLPVEITQLHGLEYENGILDVQEQGAELELKIHRLENSETYVRFNGLDMDDSGLPMALMKVYRGDVCKYFHSKSAFNKYTTGMHSFLINMGYEEKASQDRIRIVFDTVGTYHLEGLEVYAQPMDSYCEWIGKLTEDVLQKTSCSANRVSGTIELDTNKILYMQIPYLAGWSAYVDGRKTEIIRADTGYMALPLSNGKHEILFVYHTVGSTAGIVISFFFVIASCIMARFKKRNSRRI